MASVTIQAYDNGPLLVKGEVDLLDGKGEIIETVSDVHLCRCGHSTNFPYCTGAHRNGFKNEVRSK